MHAACAPAAGCWAYLQGIQGQLNDSSGAAVGGGLRPTEVNLSAGCVEEIDANYKGALLSDVLSNVKSGDDCCAQCRHASLPLFVAAAARMHACMPADMLRNQLPAWDQAV